MGEVLDQKGGRLIRRFFCVVFAHCSEGGIRFEVDAVKIRVDRWLCFRV